MILQPDRTDKPTDIGDKKPPTHCSRCNEPIEGQPQQIIYILKETLRPLIYRGAYHYCTKCSEAETQTPTQP